MRCAFEKSVRRADASCTRQLIESDDSDADSSSDDDSSSDEAEASGIEEDDSDEEEEEAGLPCREPWAGISAKTLRGILRQCHWEATRLAMQDGALKDLGPIGHFRNPPAPVKGMALSREVEGSIFEKLEKE